MGQEKHRGHHRAGQPVRALPVSPHRGPQGGRVGGEREARGTHLAGGGAQGSAKATEEGAALAERRILCPSQAGATESRLVLRFR